jgi:hypothetical protein
LGFRGFFEGALLQTISILFLLTLALMLAMKFFVAPKYGRDVEGRFLERFQYIPSQTEVLSSATLGRWLADEANGPAIRGYVFPVLFPFDIAFLFCLGLVLGLASGEPARISVQRSGLGLVGFACLLHCCRFRRRQRYHGNLQVVHHADRGFIRFAEHRHRHQACHGYRGDSAGGISWSIVHAVDFVSSE